MRLLLGILGFLCFSLLLGVAAGLAMCFAEDKLGGRGQP